MTKFVYIGGLEYDGTEMPAATTIFKKRFALGQPVDVTDAGEIAKLKGSRFFELYAEDIAFVEVVDEAPKPKAKKPKAKAPEPVEADPSEIAE